MTNKELAEILLKHPDNEAFTIRYDQYENRNDLFSVDEVYDEEEGKTVIAFNCEY